MAVASTPAGILLLVTIANVAQLSEGCAKVLAADGSYTVQGTSVDAGAFFGCAALKSVKMPLVTSIGSTAFNGCAALTSADMPLVTSIGYLAFNGCAALKSVKMPLVTSIEYNAFSKCAALTSADMPLVTSIGANAFYGCAALKSVKMPLVTSIGYTAFQGCAALTSADMPLVTSIGAYAFYKCAALANLGLNLDFTRVMDIGRDAFSFCAADLCIPEQYFTADWEAAGMDACSGALSFQPINVVLVIDKSSSTRCDRSGFQTCIDIRAAFDAIMLRVDLSTGSKVSIVSYSASASIHLLGSNNHSEISDTLMQSSPLWNTEPGTDYMSGLSKAKLALDNENISNILPKVIIFYTDGYTDGYTVVGYDRATAMANRLKGMGVSICAVGSGEADYDTLSEMASEGLSYYGSSIQYITQLRSFCNLWPAPVPKLKTAVVIAGSIDQFERRRLSSVQDGLRSKIAQATNVASEAVELQITPGSVRLEFTVTFESNASAFAGRNVLMDRMATPELAGQLLSSDAMEVTVETIEIYPNLFVDSYSEPPLLPPPPPPPSLPSRQPPPPSAPWPHSTATLPPIYIVMVVLGSLSALLTAAVGIDFIGRFRVKSKIHVEGDGKGRSTFPRNTHCCGLCFILSLLSTSILLGVGLNPSPTPPPPIPLPLPAGVTSQYACAPACDNENLAASMVYARQIGDNAIAGFDALPAAERATLLEPAFAAADEASRRLAYVRIFEALLPGGESLKQLGSDLEDADFTLTSLQSTTAILLQCFSIDRPAGKNDRRTCTNTCEFTWSNQTFNQSNNGVCEDGGDQWWHTDPTISHDCLRGSDCNDCGWLGAITMEWRTAPFWGGAFTGGAASLIAKPNVTDTLEACPRSFG